MALASNHTMQRGLFILALIVALLFGYFVPQARAEEPEEAELLASIAQTWDVSPEPNWAVGSTLMAGMASGARAYSENTVTVMAPADAEPTNTFGLVPTAVQTRVTALEGLDPRTEITTLHQLGISNSFVFLTRLEDDGNKEAAKLGAGYFFKRSIFLQAYMDQDGGLSGVVDATWNLPGLGEEAEAYKLGAHVYHDPHGDTGGSVWAEHMVVPDGSQVVRAGVGNLFGETFWFAAFGVNL